MPRLSKNFHTVEFTCRCGCGFGDKVEDIHPDLVVGLQLLRDKVGLPIYVNSGCRCEHHNKFIGGSPSSQHMEGTAADVWCTNFDALMLAAFEVPQFAAGGIGIYKSGFLHLDVRGYKARWYGN